MIKKFYKKEILGVCSPTISNSSFLVNKIKLKYKHFKLNKKNILKGDDLSRFLCDCDHAIVGLEKIDRYLLKKTPKIKKISKFGVGVNNLDLSEIRRLNIKLYLKQGINKRSVSELILSFMLISLRNLDLHLKNIKEGKWKKKVGNLLSEKKVGIIGFGNIGQDVYRLLKSFNNQFYVNDLKKFKNKKNLNYTNKKNIYKKCDVICLTLPLTSKTTKLITEKDLKLMKKNVIIINTSRGEIINEQNMISYLTANKSSYYCADVFVGEPDINKKFLELDNFLGSPHIGGSTEEDIIRFGNYTIDVL